MPGDPAIRQFNPRDPTAVIPSQAVRQAHPAIQSAQIFTAATTTDTDDTDCTDLSILSLRSPIFYPSVQL
jgi:hypothetical protein